MHDVSHNIPHNIPHDMHHDILIENKNHICYITLNRIKKSNAFDDQLLLSLKQAINIAIDDASIDLIVLNANGKYFSAGADLAWMQKMIHYNKQENIQDALILADTLETLYQCPKPTLAIVQGNAYGGGVGLIAACDIAIATDHATFSFSEVKLGLIPAVISPYVINAIGARLATWLFMTAETISAEQAKQYNLIHYCIAENKLGLFTENFIKSFFQLPKTAKQDAKALVRNVQPTIINTELKNWTAQCIAQKRISPEAQQYLKKFIELSKSNTK